MSGEVKFSQLIVIIVFACAMVLLGYRELTVKYASKYKDLKVPQEQLEKVKAIYGTDIDIKQASFDPQHAKRASLTQETRKSDPKFELKSLMRLLIPEKDDKTN